jgi:uncharacterized protein YjbJ (UPF0337 family)
MNKAILDGKWHQLRGALREQWGRLTDDDIRILLGRTENLVGLLEERYGYTREKAEQEVKSFLARFGYHTPSPAERLRRTVGRYSGIVMAVSAGAMLLAVAIVVWRMVNSDKMELESPVSNADVETGAAVSG